MMPLLLHLLSVLCAVLPMLGFLLLMWWLDRYDREPLWLVGLTFLWGAVGAVFIALIGNYLGFLFIGMAAGDGAATLGGPVLVAPLVEEPAKALILLFVARSRYFDNMTDGFVYGAAAGLGFGMTENFFYFSTVGASGDVLSWGGTVLIRTFYSALMHAAATSCVGAALGFSRLRGRRYSWLSLPVGLGIAMSVHALWNGLLSWDQAAELNGQMAAVDMLIFPLEFLVVAVVYQGCLLLEARTLHAELAEEANLGTLPAGHVPVLASYLTRSGRGWLPRGVPHAAYIHAATTLAFRRGQSRHARADERAWYAAELARLRAEITGLLAMRAPTP